MYEAIAVRGRLVINVVYVYGNIILTRVEMGFLTSVLASSVLVVCFAGMWGVGFVVGVGVRWGRGGGVGVILFA